MRSAGFLGGFLIAFLSALAAASQPASAQQLAACTVDEMVEHAPAYHETFGSGPGRFPDPNVQNHIFLDSGEMSDGYYAVSNSHSLNDYWLQTDLIGHVDADGTSDGRYLAVNVRGNLDPDQTWLGEIYRVNNIPIVPSGITPGSTLGGFRFSAAVAGTCNGDSLPWCQEPPSFTVFLENADDGSVLGQAPSSSLGLANDDRWRAIKVDATVPPSIKAVNVMLMNTLPNGLFGNDMGIDNITIRPLICSPPAIRGTKRAALNNAVTGQPTVTDVGDQIVYTYTYTNTGITTAYNITVAETLFDGAGTLPVAVHSSGGGDYDGNGVATDVKPGDTIVFTATYDIIEEDIVGGGIKSQATISGTDLLGTSFHDLTDSEAAADDTGGDDDPNFTELTAVPSITVEKTGILEDGGDGAANPGDRIRYQFTLRNTGNVSLGNVEIGDPGATVVGGRLLNLPAGASDNSHFTASYVLEAADVVAGQYTNTAIVRARAPDGSIVTDLSDDPTDRNTTDREGDGEPDGPTIVLLPHSVLKAHDDDFSSTPLIGAIGGMTASVLVNDLMNAKQVALNDISSTSDPSTPAPSVGAIAMNADGTITVAAGTSAGRYSLRYQICESINPTNCDSANALVIVTRSAIVAMDDDFTGTPLNGATGGSTVSVIGNDTLHGSPLRLSDIKLTPGRPPTLPAGGLSMNSDGAITATPGSAPGIYNFPYEVCETLNPDNCDDAMARVSVATAGLSVELAASLDDDRAPSAGDKITFSYRVRNTGSSPLRNVVLSVDTFTGNAAPPQPIYQGNGSNPTSGGSVNLAAGDTAFFSSTYQITQSDLDKGQLSYQVVGSATDFFDITFSNLSDDPADSTNADRNSDRHPDDVTVVQLRSDARISLEKQGTLKASSNNAVRVGDLVNYRFTIKNVGNRTLNDIRISDPNVTVQGALLRTLRPGESDDATFMATYTVTQADIDAGLIENTAFVQATDSSGVLISDWSDDPENPLNVDRDGNGDPDDPTTTELPATSSLTLQKTGELQLRNGDTAEVGDEIRYIFVVTNSGNQTLTNIKVRDPKVEVSGHSIEHLAPGQVDRTTFTASYRLTSADIKNGRVENTATAEGFNPRGELVSVLSDDPHDRADRDSDNDGHPDDPTVILLPVSAPPLTASKSVSNTTPIAGDVVTYSLTFENTSDRPAQSISIVDELPAHVRFVPNSATIAESPHEPKIEGRRLIWQSLDIPPNDRLVVKFDTRISVLDQDQAATNRTWAEDRHGDPLSNTAEVTIHRRTEHLFDCADVIGKVFHDANRNARQDRGELGISKAQIVTPNGEVITADDNGRFSVPCAALPRKTGENVALKLDARSLPAGYSLTTENPKVLRFTAGKMSRINFGVAASLLSEIKLTNSAFVPGSDKVGAALDAAINQMALKTRNQAGVIKLTYYRRTEAPHLLSARLNAVERRIQQIWRGLGLKKPAIERTSVQIQ